MKRLICLAGILLLLSGCGSFHPGLPTIPELPTTGTEKLMQTTTSTGLLFILGAIGLALGVASVFNGSKSAVAWCIASLVLIGLSLTVAKYGTLIALLCLVGGVGWFAWSLFIKKGFLTLRSKK